MNKLYALHDNIDGFHKHNVHKNPNMKQFLFNNLFNIEFKDEEQTYGLKGYTYMC